MSLAKHLARQSAAVAQLIDLLEKECQTLAQGDIDGPCLGAFASNKQALLQEIERLEDQRRQAQQRLGYGDDRQGADRAAADAACESTWRQLLALASRARQLNQLNGESIRARLELNQRLLNFIHAAGDQGLYGPDGQSRHRRLRSLASRA